MQDDEVMGEGALRDAYALRTCLRFEDQNWSAAIAWERGGKWLKSQQTESRP
jgi:hypothetical protein